MWQMFLAQNDRVHLIYRHNIRFKLEGDGKERDMELVNFIAKRWEEHSRHALVTGLKSTGAAKPTTAAVSAPIVFPPLGLNPAALFTLHKH